MKKKPQENLGAEYEFLRRAFNDRYDLLTNLVVDPSEQLFEVVERDVTHVGDSESFFFQLAVAVSENGIVLFLDCFDSLGNFDAASVLDRC